MSLRAKQWRYRNQHCYMPCLKQRKGEMCQCKFNSSPAGQLQKQQMNDRLKAIKEKVDVAKQTKNNS